MTLALHLCDVFADRPLSGNSLSVVIHDEPLDTTFMQALTGELRQFETAFLSPTEQPGTFATRVFDLHTELAFAGHPLLGAAAVLHSVHGTREREEWRLSIHGREVPLATTRGERPGSYITHMDQGAPAFLATADARQAGRAASAFALDVGDLAPGVPLQVVSTGLRYLVVPIVSGLDRARIVPPRLQELLDDLGAEFAYLIDVRQRAGRHWENDGSLEDIATGSAAGVVGAFLVRHGLADPGERIVLRQGDFVGRPSALHVTAHGTPADITRVELSGPVTMIGCGVLSMTASGQATESAAG
jgi:trans-2,3-dihydro-3-hydroxyanthranilate isomerase